MKRLLVLAIILVAGAAAIFFAQRRPRQDAVSANAVVNMVADWQRDAARAPLRATRLSDNEETRIGDELAQQYAGQWPTESAEAAAMERYVRQVGGRVAAHAHRKLNFRFHFIADPGFVNAFALPGGHVFIGQGLTDLMTSEDELAFVLAHEIEHIDHYHAVERVQVEANLRHLDLDALAGLAGLPLALWQVGYSKDEEFEADREGLLAMSAAEYAPQGAVRLLEKFVRLHNEYVVRTQTPGDEMSRVAIEGLTGYFRSHPLPSERLDQAKLLITQEHLPENRPLQRFRLEYEVHHAAPAR